MRRSLAVFASVCLVVALPAAASSEEPGAAVWIGGRVETPDYALTIPDDWIAVEPSGGTDGLAEGIARRISAGPGSCDSWCEQALRSWLSGQEGGVLALIGPVGGLDDDRLTESIQCHIYGPGSAAGRTVHELAEVVFDAFARSDLVEVSDAPSASWIGDAEVSTFDYLMSAGELPGVAYLYSDGERVARLSCQGPRRPADDWLSLAETFELSPVVSETGADSGESPATTADVGASDLQSMLPLWVGGQSLLTHSHQGLDYLRNWSRMPQERLREVEDDPQALDRLFGFDIELDDIQFAMAGRASRSDAEHYVTALRIRGIPAEMLPLSMVASLAGTEAWGKQTFGTREVQVGTDAMVDRPGCCRGRPYVYDVGQVRFTVYSDDEDWAAEAVARLRPDPVVEDAAILFDIPDPWQPGYSPTVLDTIVADAYDAGVRVAAHDATHYGQRYIPTMEVFYSDVRLDEDVPATLDRWAATYPVERAHGRTVTAIERISLPSGEGLRLDMVSSPPKMDYEVAEVRYLIATPSGVFDVLFSMEADDLADHETTIHEIAGSLLRDVPDSDGPLARLARGETTRTELEMVLGGYRASAAKAVEGAAHGIGPLVRGGRLEVPLEGFALEAPDGWYAIDVTHRDAVAEMRTFDATTQSLLEGRLLPENPLLRGNFASAPEVTSLAKLAIEELAAPGSHDQFALLALAPPDGLGAAHECVVYVWAADAEMPTAEAELTLELIRENDPDASLHTVGLPAGEAAMISASTGSWEFVIYTLIRDELAYNLECGHHERHDQLWQEIATSFAFLDDE